MTRSGQVIGTPDYMSLEQISGEVAGRESDIYSLGIVAFNALTGELPFKGTNAQSAMLLRLARAPAATGGGGAAGHRVAGATAGRSRSGTGDKREPAWYALPRSSRQTSARRSGSPPTLVCAQAVAQTRRRSCYSRPALVRNRKQRRNRQRHRRPFRFRFRADSRKRSSQRYRSSWRCTWDRSPKCSCGAPRSRR